MNSDRNHIYELFILLKSESINTVKTSIVVVSILIFSEGLKHMKDTFGWNKTWNVHVNVKTVNKKYNEKIILNKSSV